jgi:hypothetical protein
MSNYIINASDNCMFLSTTIEQNRPSIHAVQFLIDFHNSPLVDCRLNCEEVKIENVGEESSGDFGSYSVH